MSEKEREAKAEAMKPRLEPALNKLSKVSQELGLKFTLKMDLSRDAPNNLPPSTGELVEPPPEIGRKLTPVLHEFAKVAEEQDLHFHIVFESE